MDIVIHLAGKPVDEQRWTPQVKEEIYTSRVHGTEFISETISELQPPPRLFISASATDYYCFPQSRLAKMTARRAAESS